MHVVKSTVLLVHTVFIKYLNFVQRYADIEVLQCDLDSILRWCDRWKMFLSTSKCINVRFTRKRKEIPSVFLFFLGNQPLDLATEVKHLGVQLFNALMWNNHDTGFCSQPSGMFRFPLCNFREISVDTKQTGYFSDVRPILEYACIVWDAHRQICINQVERIQNQAASFVSDNYNFRESVSEIKHTLG